MYVACHRAAPPSLPSASAPRPSVSPVSFLCREQLTPPRVRLRAQLMVPTIACSRRINLVRGPASQMSTVHSFQLSSTRRCSPSASKHIPRIRSHNRLRVRKRTSRSFCSTSMSAVHDDVHVPSARRERQKKGRDDSGKTKIEGRANARRCMNFGAEWQGRGATEKHTRETRRGAAEGESGIDSSR